MVLNRIYKLGKILVEHKKKSAVGAGTLFFAGRYFYKRKIEADIRQQYAREALKYGHQKLSPEERPRRVVVLANVLANNGRVFEKFKINALPLLNLAGIEVSVIKVESAEQMENIASEIDSSEADALYIVGGDGTLSRVVTGLIKNSDKASLPFGVFPGGDNNRSLISLVPEVFSISDKDIRKYLESAMALIEERKRFVFVTKYTSESSNLNEVQGEPIYGLSDANLGWFLHTELKKAKLWYWGGLKRRFAYFWEMLKREPVPLIISATYEEFCPGCSACRLAPISKTSEQPQWKWWYYIFGSPANMSKEKSKDFSKIVNENCHKLHPVTLRGTDILAETAQANGSSKVIVKAGGSNLGRTGVMREGWKRCKHSTSVKSPNPDEFYDMTIECSSITFSLAGLPELIRKFAIFGEVHEQKEEPGDRRIRFEATDKKLEVYLPVFIRVDLKAV